MKRRCVVTFCLILGTCSTAGLRAMAQAPALTPAPARGGAAGGRPARIEAYPDRPKAVPEVLDRGKGTYGVNCAFCHGSDAGGGEVGPNLLRSSVVLEDQSGELIAPIVHGSRVDKGMPRVDLTEAQIADVAAWLHSLHVASRTAADESINIVTGSAAEGQVAFQKQCSSCHSVTGDLKGFGALMPNPKTLQQTWMLPGGAGGRGGGGFAAAPVPGLHVPPTTVTVTLPGGSKVTGKLNRIDDFYVGLTEPDGTIQGFTRMGAVPKVELHDPLAAHRELLRTYTDKDIHDITAYLVTVK